MCVSFSLSVFLFHAVPRVQSRSSKVPKQVEEMIDEKCRSLNKTGVPKGSALHLAQWMKGQLDKQVVESDPIDPDPEVAIEEWSVEQVATRSKELKLVDTDGILCKTLNGAGSNLKLTDAHLEDGSTYDGDDDNRSVSKSTTSDSQVSVFCCVLNKEFISSLTFDVDNCSLESPQQ